MLILVYQNVSEKSILESCVEKTGSKPLVLYYNALTELK